jgi:hypothetical protein
MEHRLEKSNPPVSAQIRALRQEIGREFGLVSRLSSRLLGPVLLWTTIREEGRLARGVTYEPEPILERRNWLPAGGPSLIEAALQAGGGIPAPLPQKS